MSLRWSALLFGLCMIIACTSNSSMEGLYTFDGDFHQLKSRKAKVVMLLAPDCPLCQNYSTEFVRMAESLSSEKLEFIGVLPGLDYEEEEIAHFRDSFQFKLPILLDSTYEYTRELAGQVTPQFYLIDSTSKVLYTGKFNNWATGLAQKRTEPTEFYLKDAITSYLQSEDVALKYTEPIGCVIEVAE